MSSGMSSPEARRAELDRRNARDRARYASDPEYRARKIAAAERYEAANLERCRAYGRKTQRTRSGIINATGETRSGICPICLKDRRKLHCDHDHTTGKIRGWLCNMCNIFLGPDDDGRVARAAEYIRKAKEL